ncbi:hypothetical protein BANRA_05230 [Klebsiella pneumoniae]|nr:hypothetical protein BANRA_05230 [Klebsiella pneumoniae]
MWWRRSILPMSPLYEGLQTRFGTGWTILNMASAKRRWR